MADGPGWAGWNQYLNKQNQGSWQGLMQHIANNTGPQNNIGSAPFGFLRKAQYGWGFGGGPPGDMGAGQWREGSNNSGHGQAGFWQSPYGNGQDLNRASSRWLDMFKNIYGFQPGNEYALKRNQDAQDAVKTGLFQNRYLPGGNQYQYWLNQGNGHGNGGGGGGGGGGNGNGNGGGNGNAGQNYNYNTGTGTGPDGGSGLPGGGDYGTGGGGIYGTGGGVGGGGGAMVDPGMFWQQYAPQVPPGYFGGGY